MQALSLPQFMGMNHVFLIFLHFQKCHTVTDTFYNPKNIGSYLANIIDEVAMTDFQCFSLGENAMQYFHS